MMWVLNKIERSGREAGLERKDARERAAAEEEKRKKEKCWERLTITCNFF